MKYDKEHHGSPAKNRGGRNDHDMSDKYWEAHKKTIHGMKSHGGINMNSPANAHFVAQDIDKSGSIDDWEKGKAKAMNKHK